MQSYGAPFRICVSNSKRRQCLNSLFTDDVLAGMLGATDIEKLDMISPFIRALLYRICGESESCKVAKVFTEYVDVNNKVCGHNG